MGGFFRDRDSAFTEGVYTTLTVGTSAVEAKVGASKQDGRQWLILRPKDTGFYWGFDSSVTTSTGCQLFKDELVILPFSVSIYLINSAASKAIFVGEAA